MSWSDSPERRQFEQATGRELSFDRRDFVADMRAALVEGRGFAAGKLGISEHHWLYYPSLLAEEHTPRKRWAFEQQLFRHFQDQSGLFPATPNFCRSFAPFYAEQVHQLDDIGIMLRHLAIEIANIRHYNFSGRLLFFTRTEPDRSIPANDDACYLPYFRGKRLLLICPFATVLAGQANRECFERVWAKTGKRWFEPASVEAVEFPYGFEPTTRQRYATALDLLEEIMGRVSARDFDVALIGAGGLGIPLAARIKAMGKIAISLGGHLQVLFGVLGKRWRESEQWQRDYINDAWINVPSRYLPTRTDVCDNGDYW